MAPRRNNSNARKKAGHRSWAAGSLPVPGTHTGDIMSEEKRSLLMSRIKGRNTGPERIIMGVLRKQGIYFSRHSSDLPGRPDIVFRRIKLAVFLDGDFWHGWRFQLWQHKLSEKWRNKISATRKRDLRNFRRLRRLGWRVLRIWEHEIERSPERCIARIDVARNKINRTIENTPEHRKNAEEILKRDHDVKLVYEIQDL